MVDFLFSNSYIVMLSFLEQVGASLELMGEVRLLVWTGFFFVSCLSIVMLSIFEKPTKS